MVRYEDVVILYVLFREKTFEVDQKQNNVPNV